MSPFHFFTTGRLVFTERGWIVCRGLRTIEGPTRYHADAVLMLERTLPKEVPAYTLLKAPLASMALAT